LTTTIRRLSYLCLAGGLVACSASAPPEAARPEAAVHLTATLVSPIDITLKWNGSAAGAAGHVVEFATEPDGVYTILQFVPSTQTQFTHPDLVPETAFYYRVRPYHGPASSRIEVALPAPPAGEDLEKDDGAWAQPQSLRRGASAGHAIRSASPPPEAAPTDLKASIVHSTGVRFTWTDRARDEDGYLLEVQAEGHPEFSVAAVLDPDVDTFGLITLPSEKRAAFRVRAFYYGKPSNLAHEKTGAEPPRDTKAKPGTAPPVG
jgi:hypothetical protein